ncbi:hypothetical protein QTH91_05755 [Variovorax dokdonensis]|uniref:Transmembrane protein n=1 Tax=Variovorax dokdonensis TaxID=344883 RepID=A0ABT7N7Q7_9BURK|nr:hypothetical protein [Variovorax dokdonensis]MDM0043978.1 hypothetical protein [Variovorax dokdonensis]
MHLVIIAWLYVALMMAVAEATNTTGTVLGAIVTFVLYGLLPMALVAYLGGTPARRRAMRAREREQDEARRGASTPPSDAPDQGREAPADPIAPVRKEP